MKRNQSAVVALLLALLMLCMPVAGGAQELAAKHRELTGEAVSGGLAVTRSYTLEAPAIPVDAQTASAVNQAFSSMRLDHTRFDDIDAVYDLYTWSVGDEPLADAQIKTTSEETLIQTSLLPGKVLSLPSSEEDRLGGLFVPLSPFQLFTFYLPNLPGGVLSLTEDEVAYIDSALAMYLYRIGAWVSETHRETGNLYEYIFDGLPASDARDAAPTGFEANMTATDIKALLRFLADGFYEDAEMYPVIAHYLSAFGVTEQDVYDFSRAVPQGPLSNGEEGITPIGDAALFFGRYDNGEGELVGLEIDLPQLYEEIPFSFELDYGAKREQDGLRGEGYVGWSWQEKDWSGDVALWEGDVVEDMQSTLYSLQAQTSEEVPSALTAYAMLEARELQDDTVQSETRANVVYSSGDDLLTLDFSSSRETRHLEDGNLSGESSHLLLVTQALAGESGTLQIELKETMRTGTYALPEFQGERVALMDLSEEDVQVMLTSEIFPQVLLAAQKAITLMPEEVSQLLAQIFAAQLPDQ